MVRCCGFAERSATSSATAAEALRPKDGRKERQRAQLVEAPDVPGYRRLLQANLREVLQEAQYFDGARYLEGK